MSEWRRSDVGAEDDFISTNILLVPKWEKTIWICLKSTSSEIRCVMFIRVIKKTGCDPKLETRKLEGKILVIGKGCQNKLFKSGRTTGFVLGGCFSYTSSHTRNGWTTSFRNYTYQTRRSYCFIFIFFSSRLYS
jgi:hypothetical protein